MKLVWFSHGLHLALYMTLRVMGGTKVLPVISLVYIKVSKYIMGVAGWEWYPCILFFWNGILLRP